MSTSLPPKSVYTTSFGERVFEDCLVETISRNMKVEAASGEVLEKEMRHTLLGTGGKVILVISWQEIWANCALRLCGKQSFQAVNIEAWLRSFPTKC